MFKSASLNLVALRSGIQAVANAALLTDQTRQCPPSSWSQFDRLTRITYCFNQLSSMRQGHTKIVVGVGKTRAYSDCLTISVDGLIQLPLHLKRQTESIECVVNSRLQREEQPSRF